MAIGPDSQKLVKHFVEEDTVLRAYVLAATSNYHDAQDILQTIWTVLWKKFDDYDEKRSFRAWAFGVARLEVLKWRQKRARSRESLSEKTLDLLAETAMSQTADLDMRATHLRFCLKKLDETWKRVIAFKYLKNMGINEISQSVGKSVAAVEMILVRARRALRDCVENRMRDPSGALEI
jgi:RNA polymerase sigma-70 factor, ECF subfamily